MSAAARRRRRRVRWRDWLPASAAISAAIGVAGAGVLALALQRPPPPPAAEPDPRVGDVLTAGGDSAMVLDVLELPDGARLAAVLWLRGPRIGRDAWIVVGCDERRGVMTRPGEPQRRVQWAQADRQIHDLIARAVCQFGMERGGNLWG